MPAARGGCCRPRPWQGGGIHGAQGGCWEEGGARWWSSFLDMPGLGASPSTWRRPAGRWVCDSGVGKAAWTGNVKFREVTCSV